MTAPPDNFTLISDRLIEAVGERVTNQRSEAPVGDIAGAVEKLVDHYEERGESSLRLLSPRRSG
jgi:hypothetical protein